MKLESRLPIRQLPHLVAQAAGQVLPVNGLRTLGLINFYGWVAYTLLDDFLDGDVETTRNLPAAAWALRQLQHQTEAVFPQDKSWATFTEEILSRLDAANAWEQYYARVPAGTGLTLSALPDYGDYEVLAERSWGMVIPAAGVLHAAGYPLKGKEVKALVNFFRHFLIARQLHDDAHDWEEDLQAGRLSAVVTELVNGFLRAQGKTSWEGDTQVLRTYFWQHTIEIINRKIEEQLQQARKELESCRVFLHPEKLLSLLAPLQKSLHTTRIEKAKMLTFIAEYRRV